MTRKPRNRYVIVWAANIDDAREGIDFDGDIVATSRQAAYEDWQRTNPEDVIIRVHGPFPI